MEVLNFLKLNEKPRFLFKSSLFNSYPRLLYTLRYDKFVNKVFRPNMQETNYVAMR